jgi:triphosphoribosyl-dephospho-CoA synthase
MADAQAVARAFALACRWDVAVRKPGNVSLASAGHRMEAAQFVASGEAAAPAIAAAGRPVGERIEQAVHASWAAAGCNTNLGIVLLCAPLAAAAETLTTAAPEALRRALSQVLAALTVGDAAAAYRAIAHANPAGLGRADEADVHAPPAITLQAAMALAADRDRIAWQYAHGARDLFELGLPCFGTLPAHNATPVAAVQRCYLRFVATFPDSHIVRKLGLPVAQSVMAEAAPWHARAERGEPLDGDPAYAAWDASLKARGINPGTSADLTVASAFAALLLVPQRHSPH